eukprot:6997261-Alexandrium_andersonii.AAC.1
MVWGSGWIGSEATDDPRQPRSCGRGAPKTSITRGSEWAPRRAYTKNRRPLTGSLPLAPKARQNSPCRRQGQNW